MTSRMVSVCLGAIWAVGCAAWAPTPAQTFPDLEPTSDVITLDKAAFKLVAVKALTADRTDEGRLAVRMELANLSDQDLPLQLQTLFRDEGEMLIGDQSPFEMVVLPGSGSKLYEVSSLNPKAATFTIQIKTP